MPPLRATEVGPVVTAGAVGGVLLLSQVITFQPAVHGDVKSFVAAWVLTAIAATLAAGWALVRRVPGWATGLLVLAAILPGSLLHGRRWQQREAPFQVAVSTPLQVRQAIEPTLKGTSSLRLGPDGVQLHAPAGSVGYVELHPLQTSDLPWDLPRALLAAGGAGVGEEYAWRATVELEGRYFVLAETDGLLVQLTPLGLLVGAPGRDVQAVPTSAPAGAPWEWALRRAGGRVALSSGGQVVWSDRDTGPFRYVRLGETRTDAEHGGTMRLHALRLTRFRT